MHKDLELSVILPVYKCADCILEMYNRLVKVYENEKIEFELVFINDGSPDHSWSIINVLASRDSRVVGIDLSRNFGQHFAILAGLDRARGKSVLIMDCDLEDLPEESVKLWRHMKEGYDIVWGRRQNRTHSPIKQLGSKIFYAAFNSISDFGRDPRIGNFVCFNSTVLLAVRSLREQTRFVPALLDWVGFKVAILDVEHGERFAGFSAYSLPKLVNLAFDALVSHSLRPLFIILKAGLLISFSSFVLVGWVLFRYLTTGIPVTGWTTLIVSIGVSTGVIISLLGIIGIYVGKIFLEVKGRPPYLIKATTSTSAKIPDRATA